MTRFLRWYESLLRPLAHYPPEYSLTKRVNDGAIRGLPRIVHHALWALYAAAITASVLTLTQAVDLHPGLIKLFVAGVLPLWMIKIVHVLEAKSPRPLWRQPDILDWLCDVGAWGSFGALITLQLVGGFYVSPATYIALVALYLVTYPWASP